MQQLTPEQLKEKIENIRHRGDKKRDPLFSRSIVLVTSLGFSVILCIGLGVYLGDLVVKKTGNDLWLPVFIFIGVIFAAYSAYKMLKPFWNAEDRGRKAEGRK